MATVTRNDRTSAETHAGLSSDENAIIEAETGLLRYIQTQLAEVIAQPDPTTDYDRELLSLRDQLHETHQEDHAMLVEHMTRLSALRSAKNREYEAPVDPKSPYFAHIQLRDTKDGDTRIREVVIGKRSFIDTNRNVRIVDWRNSPISRIYYCYDEGDDYEEKFADQLQRGHVDIRRTLTLADGRVTRIRAGEEVFVRTERDDWARQSDERSRLSGGAQSALRAPDRRLGRAGKDQRLPEITALIDPAQFRLITQDNSGIIVIRGGAGTGKTTIALHRIAYLAFQNQRRFNPKSILVITPGEGLRKYVSKVLPALDVNGVRIRTFPEWVSATAKWLVPRLRKRKSTDETPLGARRLKRHPGLLKILQDEVKTQGRDYDDEIERIGGAPFLDAWVRRRTLPPMQRLQAFRKWALGAGRKLLGERTYELKRLLDTARSELEDPFETWAELLTDRGKMKKGLEAQGIEYYDWELDQLVETVTEQSDDPSDGSGLGEHGTGVDGQSIFAGEIRGRLDTDDWTIILRVCQLKYGRLTGPSDRVVSMEHVIVDEAQDLSPLSIKVLCDSAKPGAPITLAGDTAQRLYLDGGFSDWDQLIKDIGVRASVLPPLAVSYRSTRQVMELARHVLGDLADDTDVRDARDGAPVELLRFDETGEAVAFLADALKSLRMRERRSSVALVARSMKVASMYYTALRRAEVPDLRLIQRQDFDFTPGIDVTDVYQIKGLEYDYIVVLEPTLAQYPETTEARHLLHVVMTRAAHQLWLLCSDTPSPLLPASIISSSQV
jgi:DNA helicase-2/ATP-dependent DNA helicase PcrA